MYNEYLNDFYKGKEVTVIFYLVESMISNYMI